MSKILTFLAIVIYFFILFPTSISAKGIRPILRFEAKIDKQFNNDSYRKKLGVVTAVVTIVNDDMEFKKWASSDSTLSRSIVFPLEAQVPGQAAPCGGWDGCVKYGDILLSVTVPDDFQVSRTNPIFFDVALERKGGADGAWQLTDSPAIRNRVAQIGVAPARIETYISSDSHLIAEPNIPVTYTWTPDPINWSIPSIKLIPEVIEKTAGIDTPANALINLGTTLADKYKGCFVNRSVNQNALCKGSKPNTFTFHMEGNKPVTDQKGAIFGDISLHDEFPNTVVAPFSTKDSGPENYLFCIYPWEPLKNDYVIGNNDTNCEPLQIKEKLEDVTNDGLPSLDPESVDLSDIINNQAEVTLRLAANKHNRQKFTITMTSSVARLTTSDLTVGGIPLDCSIILLNTTCNKEMHVSVNFDAANLGSLDSNDLNPNQVIIKDEQGQLRGIVNLKITDNNEQLKNVLKNAVSAKDKCKDKDSPDCSKAGGESCGTADNPGFKTAIGSSHSSPAAFVKDFLTFAVGIGGGLAFIMMLFGAFQMMTSGGNPQNLQGGKDTLQNAIIGLLFIIFSILLMKIIGIDILGLPGFGNP